MLALQLRLFFSVSTIIVGLLPSYVFAQAWPNEPSGSTIITDWPFTTMTGSGWGDAAGNHQIVTDSLAPLSPPYVYQQTYPLGFEGGSSPAAVYYTFPASEREMYLGFWWKANAGWEAHPSGINKILFVSREDGGNSFVLIMSGQDPYNLAFAYQEGPWICNDHISGYTGVCGTILMQGSEALVSGNWYRIELYMKMSTTTTSKDGIVKWFVNGHIAGNLTTVNFDQIPFKFISIVPVWGGSAGVFKTQTDYFQYDHVYVSIPPGGTSPPPPPPPPSTDIPVGPPGQVTGVTVTVGGVQ